MICCNTAEKDQSNHTAKSKQIEEQLKQARKIQSNRVKLLLLGTGDSGKSTFVKQMKVIYKNGFSTVEVKQFNLILQENCLASMQRILHAPGVTVPKRLKEEKKIVLDSENLSDCAECVESLWNCKEIQQAFEKRNELTIQVPSNAPYFFQNLKRISSNDFVPTTEDIFRAKIKTTGIIEVSFQVEGMEVVLIDVGGQRSERRKWLHLFDDVTSIIYLAALDDYNLTLEEDNKTNRFEESLRLFGEITNSPFFKPASWILFLNKSDLFRQKIKKEPLSLYFDDIDQKDAVDFDKACEYMKKKYESTFQGNRLYVFVTCALDTDNCKLVWNSVKDTVLLQALAECQSNVI